MIPALTRRFGGAALALASLVLLHGAWRITAAHAWVRLTAAAILLLAAVRPRDALLVIAGLGPVAGTFGAALRVPFSLRELLVLAAVTGWSLALALRRFQRPLLPEDLRWPVLCAVIVVAASAAVELHAQRELLGPAEFSAVARYTIDRGGLIDRHGMRGLAAGAVYLEGLAMFAVAAAACSRRPQFAGRLSAMAVAGAAGAALLNLQRIAIAAIASDAPLQRIRDLIASTRINIHYSDVNAAGSYFALLYFPAAGLALLARGWRRVLWLLCAAIIFAAAWITASRAAVAAILGVSFIVILAAGWRAGAWRSRRIAGALAGCAAAAALFLAFFPNEILSASSSQSVVIRLQMAGVSARILAQEPLFGAGVGGYFEASAAPLKESTIGHFYPRENAHNNFLQIVAELGVVGGSAFVWLFWAAGRRMIAGVRSGDRGIALALSAGIGAFALTALLGHPLLTPEVSHAFWLLLGAATFHEPAPAPARRSAIGRYLLVAAMAAMVLALPWRLRREANALDFEHVRYGVSSGWSRDANGVPFQNASGEVTLFVSKQARGLDIPLRLPDGGPPMTLEVKFRGRTADRIVVRSAAWQVYRLVVGSSADDPPFLRVRLTPIDSTGAFLIGRTVQR